jgi:tetratricopeptide (TPR) repeat protein
MKLSRQSLVATCCGAILVFISCATAPEKTSNQTTSANSNASSGGLTQEEKGVASPAPDSSTAKTGVSAVSTASGMGTAIDTSKYDADVKAREKQVEKQPANGTARLALAKAYLARADALTEARQYRAALGDYRRALKYDASNHDAQQMADQIIRIMKDLGRPVPAEGEEPAPLPFNPTANNTANDALSTSLKQATVTAHGKQ